MVNKTDRLGQRTGNTLRPYIWRHLCNATESYLELQVLNAGYDVLENSAENAKGHDLENINNCDLEYIEATMGEISDGVHGSCKETFDPGNTGWNKSLRKQEGLLFSMNKRQRWLLKETLKWKLYDLWEEDFKVVLALRKTVLTSIERSKSTSKVHLLGHWTREDCVEYLDSQYPDVYTIPNKTYSNITDLKWKWLRGQGFGLRRKSKKTPWTRMLPMRAREIQRLRGVQRRAHLFLKRLPPVQKNPNQHIKPHQHIKE